MRGLLLVPLPVLLPFIIVYALTTLNTCSSYTSAALPKHRQWSLHRRAPEPKQPSSQPSSLNAYQRHSTPHTNINPLPYPARVCVLGGGNFGLALAAVCARNGVSTTLLVRSDDAAKQINKTRRHPRYMSDCEVPAAVEATCVPEVALAGATFIIHAVPVQYTRSFLEKIGEGRRKGKGAGGEGRVSQNVFPPPAPSPRSYPAVVGVVLCGLFLFSPFFPFPPLSHLNNILPNPNPPLSISLSARAKHHKPPAPHVPPSTPVLSASKGIETTSLGFMRDILRSCLGPSRSYAFLSGPSFAREIMEGLATAVVIASEDKQVRGQRAFGAPLSVRVMGPISLSLLVPNALRSSPVLSHARAQPKTKFEHYS